MADKSQGDNHIQAGPDRSFITCTPVALIAAFRPGLDQIKGRDWSFSYAVGSFYGNLPRIQGYIVPEGHADPATTYQQAIENVEIMLGLRERIVDAGPSESAEKCHGCDGRGWVKVD